jgi:hypothetical protein
MSLRTLENPDPLTILIKM